MPDCCGQTGEVEYFTEGYEPGFRADMGRGKRGENGGAVGENGKVEEVDVRHDVVGCVEIECEMRDAGWEKRDGRTYSSRLRSRT